MSTAAALPARVHLTRRGGIAGLKLEASLDTAALNAAQRQALSTALAAPAAGEPSGADRFRFELAWTDAQGAAHTLALDEGAMPEGLAALLRPAP